MGVPSLVALYLQADSTAGEKASGWVHGQVEMEMERGINYYGLRTEVSGATRGAT